MNRNDNQNFTNELYLEFLQCYGKLFGQILYVIWIYDFQVISN